MFLPIGDSPQPPRGYVPWITWLTILANALVYVFVTAPLSLKRVDPADPVVGELLHRLPGATASALTGYDVFLQQWGYVPARGAVLTLFTAMFLHANLAHLVGNVLFLGIFGDNVEHRLGRAAYLATYLGTGVLATLTFTLVANDPETPMVGASGAIAGLLGCYFLMFPQNKVRVLVWLIWFDVWLVPAPVVLGVFVVVDNLLPLLFGHGSGVAYGAHLGGFFAGLAVAAVAERWHRRAVAAPAAGAASALARADHYGARGQTSAAYQAYLEVLRTTDDPVLVARARQGLARLPLDPRLRNHLRL